jgi:hypothetical protein
LAQVQTGSAFACRSRYDKPGLVPSEHAKGDSIDIGSFVLADGRRIPVKQQNFDIPPLDGSRPRFADDGLWLLHHGPPSWDEYGSRRAPAFRFGHEWCYAKLPHLQIDGSNRALRREQFP